MTGVVAWVCPKCGRTLRGNRGTHTPLGIDRAEGRCPGRPERVEYLPRSHADRLADCLEALIRHRKPHTHWLDEGLDALIAYRDATS